VADGSRYPWQDAPAHSSTEAGGRDHPVGRGGMAARSPGVVL